MTVSNEPVVSGMGELGHTFRIHADSRSEPSNQLENRGIHVVFSGPLINYFLLGAGCLLTKYPHCG